MMKSFFVAICIGLGLSLLSAQGALAVPIGTTPDTRPAAPQERKQWEHQGINLQVSGSYLNGNINLLNASSSASYNVNFGAHQLFADVGNLLTIAGDNTVANRINASLLYAWNVTPNINLYGYTTHSTDQSIKLDYRLTNGIGICRHQLFPEIFSLAFLSAGVATENEWFQDQSSPFAVRAVLRLNLALPLSDWADLGMDTFYTPAINNPNDFRVYAETYLKFYLNETLSFKFSVADEYDSRPLTGIKNNDFGVFSTLSLDWGN